VREIVDAMDANPVLCDHVHLPVQSGSNKVLASMDRLYTRDDYMRRIEWLKTAKRDYSITTDIIVGFPGETDEDFQKTMDLLDEIQYDSLFSFKYSPRPNTAALAMPDRVPDDEKQRRLVALQEKQRGIQIRRNAELIGAVREVLVEGRNHALGQWIGRTSDNRTLNFTHQETSENSLVGQYVPVRVTRSGPNSLVGDSAIMV
jgi:tRNA-2-methylthio-N6-dimethylallyladenosine synthase